MKDRVERLVVLPFAAIGCSSRSSIALGASNNGGSKPVKKPKSEATPPTTSISLSYFSWFNCLYFYAYLYFVSDFGFPIKEEEKQIFKIIVHAKYWKWGSTHWGFWLYQSIIYPVAYRDWLEASKVSLNCLVSGILIT